ncbi:MAG: hypothetical protein ACLTK4_15940 [Roseburia intestinalis]|jgi:hypothetical protein|nr:MAG TPA: hypothetical protein [Caudoviricetes sp.]DAP20684.1 MAG TPA: hypothetical protein [Caudoviricetes sp.]
MDKLTVELQNGYFVEIDPLNHTLRQRYAGQDKDGNEKRVFEQSDILET